MEGRVLLSAYSLSSLGSFDGNTDGANPQSTLIADVNGNLYGTTYSGGEYGDGTAFELAKGSGAITSLASFNGANGAQPQGAVAMDATGNLYGTTRSGGANGSGTVFEIADESNTITTLASFNGTTPLPIGGVTIDAAGNLYGNIGGPGGAVFELSKGSNSITILAAFTGPNGRTPTGALTLGSSGNLYGTTQNGGPTGAGTVFEIASGSNQITTIAAFGSAVGNPVGGITFDQSGNIFGNATAGGPAGEGGVFEIPSGSNTPMLVAWIFEANGAVPQAELAVDPSGNLYGTAYVVPGDNNGGVFEIPKGSTTVTTLAAFNGTNGSQPESGVRFDSAGNIYGMTYVGGANNDGTVFELAANTAVTLAPAGGANPSPAGQPLTFTATVSGGVPDGETVTLVDTSNNNATVASGTLAGGSATLTVPAGALAAGTHNLIAAYAGDASFAASQSAPYAQVIQAAPPTLVGAPVINGDDPNGLFNAPGQPTPGVQRSSVEDVVYTFSEPVMINDANGAFTLALAGQTTGTLPSTLYAAAVPGSNGTQWAVSLTGQPEGTLASIANGEYSITLNPAFVVTAADSTISMAPGTGRTDTFYRLFGDVQGTESVNTLDYARFKQALSTYNPIFDVDGNGSVSTLDYARFKQDLSVSYAGDGFVTSI